MTDQLPMNACWTLPARVDYVHEFAQRLRVGLAGCGGQAFRNILPAFRFAPIDLVAVCDVDRARAASFAAFTGAPSVYSDYAAMLASERLDAVFLATGYDERSVPTYPSLAAKALAAGCHVWMEKPPASTSADIERLYQLKQDAGREVAVGFMKMFTPTAGRVKTIISQPEFGPITSLYLRDPEMLPPREARSDPRRMVYLLDHLVHPVSLVHYLAGPVRRVYVEEGAGGAAIIVMKFASGASGVLHMPWGQSKTSPMERLEVVGKGANVTVERGTKLTYYRPGHLGNAPQDYGRNGDFTGLDAHAPLSWELDGYSGQPYNMHVFYQGYAGEIIYFCDRILTGQPIEVGGLTDAWHVIRLYEAVRDATDDPVTLPDVARWAAPRGDGRPRLDESRV